MQSPRRQLTAPWLQVRGREWRSTLPLFAHSPGTAHSSPKLLTDFLSGAVLVVGCCKPLLGITACPGGPLYHDLAFHLKCPRSCRPGARRASPCPPPPPRPSPHLLPPWSVDKSSQRRRSGWPPSLGSIVK